MKQVKDTFDEEKLESLRRFLHDQIVSLLVKKRVHAEAASTWTKTIVDSIELFPVGEKLAFTYPGTQIVFFIEFQYTKETT